MRNKAGFTLIEIMVSLVLVGLIAAISGTSVITATRSYLFARENNAATQKAQLALNRLNREIIELSDVRNASATCLVYESPYGRRAVALVDGTVQLFTDYASTTCPTTGGDVLVDGVQAFSILYNPNPPDGTTSLWDMAQDIRNLALVKFQMQLARPDTGGTIPFYMTVSPRNNNNSGGAELPTAASPPPEYRGKQCFVTTAAYGDADHPVVMVLRQFRDRVLLPTEPGKALVRYYYEVGPSLAAAIEDKPIACLLVRLLVTPLAGFALLTLSCPILIPVILLLSWGLARLILQILKRKSRRLASRLQGQRGAMLLTLIAAMVLFSALGAVMIGMFGTSALSQVAGNNSMKAYYLAESGFRYAASRYIAVDLGSEAANETARDNMLADELHGKTFSLATGDGVFRLDIYPYYYKVITNPTTNELVTKPPGGILLSPSNYNNKSWIKVKNTGGTSSYEVISGASTNPYPNPTEVHFYRYCYGSPPCSTPTEYCSCPWDTSFATGSLITPVCIPDRNRTSVLGNKLKIEDYDGDGLPDLAFLKDSGASAFPKKNGVFVVKIQGETNPRILAYRELVNDAVNNIYLLKSISDPNGGSLPTAQMVDPETLPPYKNFVELTKFVQVESTGTFGTGSSAVSRKVTYYTPIGYAKALPEPKKQFHDKMDVLTNWISGDDISKIGSFKAGTSYGKTMRVDTTEATNTVPGGSCLKFREFQAGLNLSVAKLPSGEILNPAIRQEWLRASNYLSYDLEMKAFYTLPNPMVKHALGLTFRLDEAGNALGFTYARGVPGAASGCDNDGIPNTWLEDIPGYTNYTPVLLFWMKEYSKKETFGSTVSSPHVTTPTKFDDPPPFGTATRSVVTGQTFWRNGDRVRLRSVFENGVLPDGITAGHDYYIRQVDYSGQKYLYLFNSEASALNTSAPYWTGLVDITLTGSGAASIIVQDPTFTKLAHQVLTSGNEYYGIVSQLSFLKSFATFMARVNEAPSVSFINGGGTAGREILSGETVYQTSNNLPGGTINAIYQVMRSPLYRAAKSGEQRHWASGTEQGVLLLERIKDNLLSNPDTAPFTSGSKIFAGNHPGGTNAGTVGVPGGFTDTVFRVRDNWLLFYVGDQDGKASADSNPFNNYRGPILRNSVLWPPDNTEDTVINSDKFTLLRFSDYVNTSLTCKVNGVVRTGSYCLTGFFTKDNAGSAGDVIRFASPDGSIFYSPQSGTVFPAGRAEFGLHAYGNDGHFTEYDDFAFQIGPGYGITRQGFLLPIQQ